MSLAPSRAAPSPAALPSTAPARAGVWLVIAAYNEGERLGRTLRGLRDLPYQIVVVDDGSRDTTAAVALQHNVWVLRHPVNLGQGAALQTGIDFALQQGADYLVTFDADGQHCAEDIERLLEPVRSGQVEVALGSRFLGKTEGLPWTRWLVLKLAVLFTRLVSHIRVTDAHNGLRALSRLAAQRIRLTQDRMAHASELLDRIREQELSFCEVPVTIRYSAESLRKGQSSWNALSIAGQLLLGRMIR